MFIKIYTNTLYYKAESDNTIKDFDIKELPALLVFKNGDLLGKIEGYYTMEEKEEIISKLNDIIASSK